MSTLPIVGRASAGCATRLIGVLVSRPLGQNPEAGDLDNKACTAEGARIKAHRPVHAVHDLADDGQTQSCSARLSGPSVSATR